MKILGPLFILVSLLGACTNTQTEETTGTHATDSIIGDTKNPDSRLYLGDDLFVLKNIRDTRLSRLFKWKDGLYTDSTFTVKFHSLDSIQKARLIPIHIAYPEYVEFEFIASQSMVGHIRQFVIHGGGDDYDELFLLTVDENNKPLGSYSLKGGLCSGASDYQDTLLTYCPEIDSFFRGEYYHYCSKRLRQKRRIHEDFSKGFSIVYSKGIGERNL